MAIVCQKLIISQPILSLYTLQQVLSSTESRVQFCCSILNNIRFNVLESGTQFQFRIMQFQTMNKIFCKRTFYFSQIKI